MGLADCPPNDATRQRCGNDLQQPIAKAFRRASRNKDNIVGLDQKVAFFPLDDVREVHRHLLAFSIPVIAHQNAFVGFRCLHGPTCPGYCLGDKNIILGWDFKGSGLGHLANNVKQLHFSFWNVNHVTTLNRNVERKILALKQLLQIDLYNI